MSRMLLAHNFNLLNDELPELSREEFAQIFIDGFQRDEIECNLIDNTHWIVEILYSETNFSAKEIAKICCQLLSEKRQKQISETQMMPDILFLGGKKTTPAIMVSETAIQLGNWGVDVVETSSASVFLSSIHWENSISSKAADNVFKIESLGKKNHQTK